MNKKLLTLAVAAALAAPTMASAEAILYGKMNVSLDYQTIDNYAVAPLYNDTALQAYDLNGESFPGYAGNDVWVNGAGQVVYTQPHNDPTPTDPNTLSYLNGTVRLAPGQALSGQNFNGWGMNKGGTTTAGLRGEGRANRFGLKGSEDLGNGLKAVYQIEIGVNFDTNYNISGTTYSPDTIYYRNTFLGLAGDWGTVLMGRHDTPLKISTAKLDLFSDTMADYNGTIGFDDVRADNAVAYISPSWSGFQLAAAIIPAGMTTMGFGQNVNSDQINSGYSLAGIYKNGPFYGSVAYESMNEEMFQNSTTSLNGCSPQDSFYQDVNNNWVRYATSYNCNQATSDYNKWRVGLGILDWNGFSLTGIYEHQDNLPNSGSVSAYTGYNTALTPNGALDSYVLPGAPEKRDLWQIQAGYAFGNMMVKAMYGQTSFEGNYLLDSWPGITAQNSGVYRSIAEDFYNGDTSSWAVGFDYNFSKRTQAYVLYTATTADGYDSPNLVDGNFVGSNRSQWDGFSLGMMHSF